ncbi:MBL fold metallo-hydrolase [Patescibacteria group bacterium]|nr:MBL fold metallo-hydrolase [Patescibacteria group bacterium]MBU2036081.1 MBL fold metallo-hydrolase [Patescibacteria group bacterium]
MVEKLIVGSLNTNCYLFYSKSKNCVIIDPGDDAEYIIDTIFKLQLNPLAVIATHGHFDHILAVDQLKMTFTIPFCCNENDKFLVKSMKKRATRWLSRKIYEINPKIDTNLQSKYKIKDISFTILSTPGHTPGSICLYSKKENILFSGDTIFSDGAIGRYDFSYSNKLDLEKSIHLILKLSNETKIYSGHGEETNVKKEKNYHK